MDPVTWAAIISAAASLGSGWLASRGAGNAADRQLTASREAQTSAERMAAAQALIGNRNMERTLGAMIARAGTNYGTFRLPILNRHGTGWPTQQQYEASLRGGGGPGPMSDEDVNYLMKHGELNPPSRGSLGGMARV